MPTNSEIRARARYALGGGVFRSEWLYAVVITLVVGAIYGALYFTGVGPLLVAGILSVASGYYFLGRVRGTVAHDQLSACIEGVKPDLGGALILGLLQSIFTALWALLFVIPGIVKSCSYAMAPYIKCDNPSIGANDAITASRKMMDGYKGKYFMLQLSFIGWYIVGAICFGVGILWVDSYVSAANAAFYEELKQRNPVGAVGAGAYGETHYTVPEGGQDASADNSADGSFGN